MQSPRIIASAVLRSALPLLLWVIVLPAETRAQPPAAVRAQPAGGVIEGAARAEDGAPLSLALVRLHALAEPDAARGQTRLTDADGWFRFDGLAAGSYELGLERIGYHAVRSTPLVIVASEALVHELRSRVEPIRLAGIRVRAGGDCLGGDELYDDPELATLWEQARRGIEARRALELQYTFELRMRQEISVGRRLLRDSREVRVDTVLSTPDSVLAREQRRHSQRRAEGFGRAGGLALHLPSEKELLADEFLDDYCLHTDVEARDGTVAVRFRPLVARVDRIDIRGVIRLDSATLAIRRLDLEWIEGARAIAQGSIEYDDVLVAGQPLRLPTAGRIAGRPTGPLGALITGATSQIRFEYSAFAPAGAR